MTRLIYTQLKIVKFKAYEPFIVEFFFIIIWYLFSQIKKKGYFTLNECLIPTPTLQRWLTLPFPYLLYVDWRWLSSGEGKRRPALRETIYGLDLIWLYRVRVGHSMIYCIKKLVRGNPSSITNCFDRSRGIAVIKSPTCFHFLISPSHLFINRSRIIIIMEVVATACPII